ncbi:MAG TPA: adenylosuccinate synthase [Planctomycetes bacterium]|nr:adenylosuccinate synthase [Planctomycetota bacterium]
MARSGFPMLSFPTWEGVPRSDLMRSVESGVFDPSFSRVASAGENWIEMRHICVVGLNWGDEGKGKIVDVLTPGVDAVVRFQGGANAGHTVYVGETRHVLHHLPMGCLHPETLAILGNGMVIEPEGLFAEIDSVPADARQRIRLSNRAHVVLPHHRALDQRHESGGPTRIGTTLRGIGPAYQDKFARVGVRLGDLVSAGFIENRLEEILTERCNHHRLENELVHLGITLCTELRDRVGDLIVDPQRLLHDLDAAGKSFLFEGAQGCLLDIDFGTYPFVTSSSPSVAGIGPGTGFSPRRIDHVVGVTKVYCTRVGEGPFPSELHGAEAEALREAGGEYGTTTGRPRRCGWLDIPALRFAVQLNDLDSIALTKADVLSGTETIPVVTAYLLDGKTCLELPPGVDDLARVEPVIEEWPGWKTVDEESMKPFITRLEAATGCRVSILSTGKRRDEVLFFPPFQSVQNLSTAGETV